jgi:excisionase family DNA binding protein
MVRVGKDIVKRNSRDGRTSNNGMTEVSAQTRVNRSSGLLARSDSSRGSRNEKCIQPTCNRVLGVDELAAFFKCSTEKIKRRARNGELPAFKFGKSWYVRERDLEKYLNRAVESTSPYQRET